MATARCYTKSGNVEKYESNCFSGVVNQYPNNFVHHIIGPNSNGNYTITYEGYDDGNSSNYDCYCKTIYGADWRHGKGEIKTFYFKKAKYQITFYGAMKIEFNNTIMFYCNVTAIPSNTVANFNATVNFLYHERLINGNMSPAYHKTINKTITNFPSLIEGKANLHNPGASLYNFSIVVSSPKPPFININGHDYEILIRNQPNPNP